MKFEYDANGAETKRVLPGNATIATTNDASGRPTRVTAKDSTSTVVADVGYSYTDATTSTDRSSIQARTSFTEQGVPAGAITSYGYDSLNRLTSAVEKDGGTTNASWAYTYDDAGNRTLQVRAGNTGATAGTITYAYDAANRISSTSADTTTWTYDGAGNQTRNGITGQTMAHNSRGAVTGIGSSTYTAFGQGNTNQLTRSGGTDYINTVGFGMLYEYGSAYPASVRNYTRTADGDLTQLRYGGGSRFYYATDHQGSVLGIFDATGTWQGGYSYSPYGEERATTNNSVTLTSNLRYAGGYLDSDTGLYKLGARYYDATLGRFTQMDPSGQESNPYNYAACNPVNATDSSGLLTTACLQALAGLSVSLIGAGLAGAAVVVGAPTLLLGAIAAVRFAVSAAVLVYRIGDAVNKC